MHMEAVVIIGIVVVALGWCIWKSRTWSSPKPSVPDEPHLPASTPYRQPIPSRPPESLEPIHDWAGLREPDHAPAQADSLPVTTERTDAPTMTRRRVSIGLQVEYDAVHVQKD